MTFPAAVALVAGTRSRKPLVVSGSPRAAFQHLYRRPLRELELPAAVRLHLAPLRSRRAVQTDHQDTTCIHDPKPCLESRKRTCLFPHPTSIDPPRCDQWKRACRFKSSNLRQVIEDGCDRRTPIRAPFANVNRWRPTTSPHRQLPLRLDIKPSRNSCPNSFG